MGLERGAWADRVRTAGTRQGTRGGGGSASGPTGPHASERSGPEGRGSVASKRTLSDGQGLHASERTAREGDHARPTFRKSPGPFIPGLPVRFLPVPALAPWTFVNLHGLLD